MSAAHEPLREGWRRRAHQFFVSLADLRGLDVHRRAWVKAYLNQAEEALFYQMARVDQVHSVRVAQTALEIARVRLAHRASNDAQRLARAGLLHDVGKSLARLGLVTRVLFVLMEQWPNPPLRGRMKHAHWVHTNHPSLGADLAERAGVEREVVELIRGHHARDSADPLQRILTEADRRS